MLLAGAAVVLVQLRGTIGAPSIMVLAAGVVLVIAAGAAGTAIGTRFPHPLAGLLGALALFLPTATAHLLPVWSIWLIPWHYFPDQLGWLPGPLTGYPPAGAHAAELASVAILAAIVALAVTVRRARARGGLAAAGVVAVAAVVLRGGTCSCAPVPAAELEPAGTPRWPTRARRRRCATASQVRYCLYPGFGRDLPSTEAPVNEVLALLPARPSQPLTVRQVLSVDFTDSGLTRGQPQQQVSKWTAQTRNAPGTTAAPSTIYLTAGQWAAAGSLTDAAFNVALAAAGWAVGFASASQNVPLLGGPGPGSDRDLAGHPRHPPPGRRTPARRAVAGTQRAAGPPRVRCDLELSRDRRGHRVLAVAAAIPRRRLPAGQGHDRPAQTEGQPGPQGPMGHLAEPAHHRCPARRRPRHPGAERSPSPYPQP